MSKRSCKECAFCDIGGGARKELPGSAGAAQHLCRRHPPLVDTAVNGSRGFEAVWPLVSIDDWCGEWVAR